MEFSGHIAYANHIPAADVEVRVFDRDEPESSDDDLTVVAGKSDSEGRFTVRYEPARYLDYDGVEGADSPVYTATELAEGLDRLRDLGVADTYQPYLEFRYMVGIRSRREIVDLLPNRSRFRLTRPLVPVEPFVPADHGFPFGNSFNDIPLPISIPGLGDVVRIPATYGLCGGMASAACDIYLAGEEAPSTNGVPSSRTKLHRYLRRRQMDTFGALGQYAVQFGQWMRLPDGRTWGTQKRTYDGFVQVRDLLDDRIPVVLGLVHEKFPPSLEIWKNHQVLAYDYEESPGNTISIRIYDPNYPKRDDVTVEAQRTEIVPRTIFGDPDPDRLAYGLKGDLMVGGQQVNPVRGFFQMPYAFVEPWPHI